MAKISLVKTRMSIRLDLYHPVKSENGHTETNKEVTSHLNSLYSPPGVTTKSLKTTFK